MIRLAIRTRTAGAILLTGWVLLPGVFALAQTATSSTALGELITKLQAQVQTLQSQVVELQSQLETVKTELKFTRALQRGATGDEVKELQQFLKQFPDIYPEGLVTGYFGSLTEAAVKRLQEKQGLESIGVVGPKTRARLNELTTEGAGASGLIPPGLLSAPGLQREDATGTPPTLTPPPTSGATSTPPSTATSTPPAPPPASATSTAPVPAPTPTPPSAATPTAPAPAPAPAPPPPASATSTAPVPAPTPAPTPPPPVPPASTAPDIRTGTGSVADSRGFPFPTGMMFYSVRAYGVSGYLYSTSYPTSPPVYFANVTSSASTATSSCDPSAPPENSYQGIANVCLFTSASNLAFSQPNAVRLYGKNSSCYRGILLFKQGNYYGAIDPEVVTEGGALNYRYWYDASGGSNFSSVCTAAASPPPPPPPPPPPAALPAPTYISAYWWGFTGAPGSLDKRNSMAGQKIVFQYAGDNSAKTTIFRLYQKTPTDSSFMRAAEFTGIDSTACGGRSVVGEWVLDRTIQCTSWVVSRVKAGTTELYPYEAGAGSFPASSYAVGEYRYYISAVNSAGEEGAPSATSKLIFVEPGTILAPTAAQSPVSPTPTFQWTVGSGWPSADFNSYYIVIFDSASPPGTPPLWTSCAPAGCRGQVIPGGVNSQVYNGPTLDPAKKYRLSIYGYAHTTTVESYLALPSAVVDFWVQSATTTSAAAPSNLAAVLDAIARAIEALRQQIGKLR